MLRLSQLPLIIAILPVSWAQGSSAEQQSVAERRPAPTMSTTVDRSSQLTRLRALQMSTSELAGLLLPDEIDGKFVSHKLMDPVFLGGPLTGVQFFARPTPVAHDLCRRDVIYASLETTVPVTESNRRQDIPVRFARANRMVQIAAAPQCKAEFGAFMAWVEPERKLEGAQQALRRLVALQRTARRNARSIEISCRTETAEKVCAKDAATLLGDLPMDRIFNVQPNKLGWRFSVMPNGPGPGLYWNVKLHDNGDKIELEWNVVPPF